MTRIVKYLKGRPRLIMKLDWLNPEGMVTTYTDSDWAGCMKTAKRTSGGIVMVGGHMIKSYSKQQKTIALSSAEAELHAMVAASAEALGVVGLFRDLGIKAEGEVYADASAALGITQRSGKGKVRHIRVQALWVQEVRCTNRLKYKKVLGKRNPADVLTKHVPKELLDAHPMTLGTEIRGGRAETAPTIDGLEAYTEEWTEELNDEGSEQSMGVVRERKEGKRAVRFESVVRVRPIPMEGKGRKVERKKRVERDRSRREGSGRAPK